MNIIHVILYMQWYWLILLFTFVYSQSLKTVIFVSFDFISDCMHIQCKLSGFNWLIVLLFIAMRDMSWCFVDYRRDSPHILHPIPPLSPLLSDRCIGIMLDLLVEVRWILEVGEGWGHIVSRFNLRDWICCIHSIIVLFDFLYYESMS